MSDALAYTPAKAAELTGVPRDRIMAAIHARELPARMRNTRHYLILRADLEAWLGSLPSA